MCGEEALDVHADGVGRRAEPCEDLIGQRTLDLHPRVAVEHRQRPGPILRDVIDDGTHAGGIPTAHRRVGERGKDWTQRAPEHVVLAAEVFVKRGSSDARAPRELGDAKGVVRTTQHKPVERRDDP